MHEVVAEAPDRDAHGITEGGEDNEPLRREGGVNAREEDGGGDDALEKITIIITGIPPSTTTIVIARGQEGGVSQDHRDNDGVLPPKEEHGEEESGAGGARTRLWCGSRWRRRRERGTDFFVIFFNVSMGRRLPRSLVYRSRLGMEFIPIVGRGGINDKSRPNLTTNIHNSSGYAGGAAQIPWTHDVNDKSRPNSTMNIQNSSGLAKGAAQIQLANTINDRSHSIILMVTPEALPKFHRQPN